jgi:cyanate permease
LINSIGNLGGAFGPSVMGWLRDTTGGYSSGLLVLATALVVEALLVGSLRLPRLGSMPSAERRMPKGSAVGAITER